MVCRLHTTSRVNQWLIRPSLMKMLEFCRAVQADLSNYDPDGVRSKRIVASMIVLVLNISFRPGRLCWTTSFLGRTINIAQIQS